MYNRNVELGGNKENQMQVTVEFIKQANELVSDLSEYINTERLLLNDLKESLEKYQEFLTKCIRENRDARVTQIDVKEEV